MRLRSSFLAALLVTSVPAVAAAETFEITPADDLIASINALEPGDELVLGGGTYNISAKLTIGVSGMPGSPIVIRAKDGEVPIITRPDAGQNTINFENASYVELRGIEVVGGSHGIRLNASKFITIEECNIHDTADVGLSANYNGSDYEGLRILRNHIHDTGGTGEGMYLGCNENGCQVHDSIIAENYIHHTNAGDVAQGDGIELKEGSYANVIRDNVIHDTKYPCIITYSTVGNGAANIIERNAMWACGDHGIQSAADAIIRNNIILGATNDAIRNQVHQSGSPSNLVIVNNTIIKPAGDAIRSDGITGSLIIANNAIYAQNGSAIRLSGELGGVEVLSNFGVGTLQNVSGGFSASTLTDLVGASYSGAPPNDVFPAVGSALIGAANTTHLPEDDFNGTAREGSNDVGAYRFDESGNPGWTLAPEFKAELEQPGEGGGGNGAGGGPGNGGGNSGGAPSDGGQNAGGDTADGGDDADGGDGGCDCALAGKETRGAGAFAAALLVMLVARGRRASAARRNGGRTPG